MANSSQGNMRRIRIGANGRLNHDRKIAIWSGGSSELTKIFFGWMLKLRLKTPTGIRFIELNASSTLDELEHMIRVTLSMTVDHDFDILLANRFPPKLVSGNDDESINTLFENNDLLVIQSQSLSGTQAEGKGKLRVKRLKQSQASSAKADNVVTLHSISSIESVRNRKVPKTDNGVRTLATIVRRSKRGAKRFLSNSQSKSIEDHLLSATSGEGGKINELLRNDFRAAVQQRYAETQALARLNAAYNGQYAINPVELSSSSRLDAVFKAEVVYSKGLQSRLPITETVDIIPTSILKESLKASLNDTDGFGRDILRPRNLANRSPRTFWSIIYHYGRDIVRGLKLLVPDITDWDWIEERPRMLSAKALENKRQKEEAASRRRNRQLQSGKTANFSSSTVPNEGKAENVTESIFHNSIVPPNLLPKVTAVLESSLSKLRISHVVPSDYVDAFTKVLCGDRLDLLASAEYENALRGRLIAADLSLASVSLTQLESWIDTAQLQVNDYLWACTCGRNEWLRRALSMIHIQNIASMSRYSKIHKNPNEILESIRSVFPDFDDLSIHDFKGLGIIHWLIVSSEAIVSRFPWILQMNGEVEEEELYWGDETYERSNLLEVGWNFDASDHERLGQEVALWVDDDENYLVTGTIDGILPESDEDPPLWKIRIKIPEFSVEFLHSKVWCEDLEENEIHDALDRRRVFQWNRYLSEKE